jgi:hypothetical protein
MSVENEILRKADKIQRLLIPFSTRDIQVANTIIGWLETNAVPSKDFREYMVIWFEINRLQSQGYFNHYTDAKGAKYVRELERTIEDKGVRRYIRKMRLNTTRFTFHAKDG